MLFKGGRKITGMPKERLLKPCIMPAGWFGKQYEVVSVPANGWTNTRGWTRNYGKINN